MTCGYSSNGSVNTTIPIRVASATENHSIQFHQYHLEDMGRVRVRKFCELEHREIAQSEIGKGYEYAKNQVVAISDAELRGPATAHGDSHRNPGLRTAG